MSRAVFRNHKTVASTAPVTGCVKNGTVELQGVYGKEARRVMEWRSEIEHCSEARTVLQRRVNAGPAVFEKHEIK